MSDSPRPRNPSQSAPRATVAEWQAAKAKVLDKLNIRAVYEDMGVKFLNRSESGGRLACYAIDRAKEKTPGSAGVTMGGKFRGYYSDYAHGKLNLSLFDFAIHFGRLGLTDYLSALKHFAAIAGVALPAGEYRSRRAAAPAPAPVRGPEPVDKKIYEDIGRQLDILHKTARDTGELTRTASRLHVHPDGLIALRVGYAPVRPNLSQLNFYDKDTGVGAPATIWPEWQVQGIPFDLPKPQRQSADRRGVGDDTRKEALAGRPRGISIPAGWRDFARDSGHLFVCEGGSDVAALYSMGLGVLGIPFKGGCANDIAILIARAIKKGDVPPGIPITVLVDRDKDGFGSTERLAQHIANILNRPVAGRFAPTISGYRPMLLPMDWEFPPVRLPFLDDETDPRWASWNERKGVAKDSREWLGWVCDADALGLDARVKIGRRFVAELGHAFDVSPEVDALPFTCDTTTDGGTGVGDLVYEDNTEEEGRAAPHKTKSPTPVPPSVVAAPAPCPLTRLPLYLTCPKPSVVFLGKKASLGSGAYIRVACGCFNCVACCERRKSQWGHHLGERFRHKLAPTPSHYWRGPHADLARVTKRVRRSGGEYASIIVPGGQAVVIASADFTGATPIDLPTALREMVDAVISVEYRPGVKNKRYRPINASKAWKLPGRSAGTGDYVTLARNFRDPKASQRIAEEMGVVAPDKLRPYVECEFPAAWDRADQILVGWWAGLEVYPDGYVKGTSPVPDPMAVFAELLAMPFAPPPLTKPKKLTARERKEAERRAKFAATPGLFDVA